MKTKQIMFEQLGYRLGWIAVTDVPENLTNEDVRLLVAEVLDDVTDDMWGEQFHFWQVCGGNKIVDESHVSDLEREPDGSREYVMDFEELLWRCKE